MPTARALVLNPLVVLTVVAAGFGGWVVYDAYRPARPGPLPAEPPPPLDVIFANKAFASLHLGMPQPAVAERLRDVGVILVDPIHLSGGVPVYSSRHEVHLLHPLPQAEYEGEFVAGPHIVTLVFDPSLAGHPLSRVTAALVTPITARVE